MKLHKKQEIEVLKVYDTWLDSYLNGDVKTYDSYLDDDYRFIGSTNNEDFLNRKDTTKFFEETADQLAGKAEIRNNKRSCEQFDEIIFITDLFDAYFLIENKWTYYGNFRFTSALIEKKEGWRFIYQHFSTPDSKAQDGETIGTELIAAENQQLRDAIKRRTVELEHKNRELEIESSLERVRSRSLAMHKSEELKEVIQVVYEQFVKLGIFVEHAGFIMDYKERDDMHIWLADRHEIPTQVKIPYFDCAHWNSFNEAKEKGKDFFINHLDFEEKNRFYQDLFKLIPKLPEEILEYYFSCPCLDISTVLLENVGLYIENFSGIPYTDEENGTLMRFGKVFQQTYTRFLDLQKAEAQVREAQIETALEKVRSRSMAMHHSAELNDVAHVLFQQLHKLGGDLWGTGFGFCRSELDEDEFWFANENGVLPPVAIPHTEDPTHKNMYEGWHKKLEHYSETREGNELKAHYDYMLTLPAVKPFFEEILLSGLSFPSKQKWHAAYFQYGYLLVITFGDYPEEKILIRFAKVFEQAYTRFLDLKKVEAQAREAQIEAVLERVRSRTMAMRRSEEMPDVANNLFLQVKELGFPAWSAGYCIWENDKNSASCSMSSEGLIQKSFSLPTIGEGYNFLTPLKNGEKFYVAELGGEELVEHYKFMRKLPVVGEILDGIISEGFDLPTFQLFHIVYFKYGYLMFITYDTVKEAHDIFMRFAKVFEQTYIRFLDLKQAEAQTRESQIELSLERIRAQVTAMKESTDLLDIVVTMRTEFVSLGHEAHYFWYMRWLPETYEKAMTSGDGTRIGTVMSLPRHIHGDIKLLADWEKSDEPAVVFAMDVETAVDYIHKMITLGDFVQVDPNAPTLDDIRHIGGLTFIMARTTHGEIGFSLPGIVPDPPQKSLETLVRFAGVFDLAYRRFEDLKAAERSNRETQIELALERVRAKSMAMHKSEQLPETAKVLFEQFELLGEIPDRIGIVIINKDSKEGEIWVTDQIGKQLNHSFKVSLKEVTTMAKLYKAWKEGKDSFVIDLSGQDLIDWLKYTKDDVKLPVDETQIKSRRVQQAAFFSQGMILLTSNEPVADEIVQLLVRFAKVFDQAYTRFLDLQKAEAQAREAQIEAALEKVRSSTMAMHKSEELADLSFELVKQIQALGVPTWFCAFNIYDDDQKGSLEWGSNSEGTYPSYRTPREGIFLRYYEVGQRGKIFLVNEIGENECTAHYDYLCSLPGVGEQLLKMRDAGIPFPTSQIDHVAYFKYGYILFITFEPAPEAHEVFKRFAGVFEQSYTRFLDLKKAEAQAREAQIESALERVRSKTIAMHNSEDMGITVKTLFEQVLKLGLDNDIRCGIGILEGTERMETRSATLFPNGEVDLKIGMLDMTIHPMLKRIKKAWKSGGTRFTDQMSGKDVIRYYTALNNEPDYPFFVDLDKLPKKQFHNSFSFSEGILFAFSPNPMSEEAANVMDRFARVFGQTYRRYVDLQKAEAQTREAKIEASLERIRSQAMAMQNSNDLVKSTAILFEEFEKLKLSVDRCGIGIFDEETRDCHLWTTVLTHEGKTELATGITSLTVHPMFIETFEAWKSQRPLQYILEGEELEDYYALVSNSEFQLPSEAIENSASLPKEYYLFTPFGAGGLYVFSATEPAKEEKNIIRRFADVFHLTYTRYEDLQKAEARALEAVKQASLDRVRGEIASMRTTDDLQRITPLIWSELEILQVPFIRCGVFIINETSSNVQVHLTTPDGKPIGALDLPIEANELTHKAVEHWRNNKVYTIHWNKEDFVNWMQSMINRGQIQTSEQYQGYSKPPESLDLHFIPFKQGMLYVGNTEPLLPEKIDLVNTLAEAFSIAYSRYEDFINLEEAKNKIENTLSDLKATQTQLIHAEKMASLGELTAGIAHEIQNPLNFVNNFSEVNAELISELLEEIDNADLEEAKAVATDIAGNEEKIMHHGKRAEAIVKGMLQHSRASNTEKQETDINALADEYLRLSYHGLRAKDKSFNAGFKTNLEKNLPRVQIVSQDIGRVLLNLINNAFYAVSAKASAKTDPNYKSEVIVSTKKTDNLLEISVSDNGSGIPADVKDKIFQPFFTTKPTGQGTGLGLSMSYDIITKGHGGKLKVETEEEKGTKFIIQIPV